MEDVGTVGLGGNTNGGDAVALDVGGSGGQSNHHNGTGGGTGDMSSHVDPEDDIASGGISVTTPIPMAATVTAAPDVKLDTGQSRDRERDWPLSTSINNSINGPGSKMGHNHGVTTLINSNSSSTGNSLSGATNNSAGGSALANNINVKQGESGDHKNSISGSNRHNHHPQPMTGNLVNNKISNSIHVSTYFWYLLGFGIGCFLLLWTACAKTRTFDFRRFTGTFVRRNEEEGEIREWESSMMTRQLIGIWNVDEKMIIPREST